MDNTFHLQHNKQLTNIRPATGFGYKEMPSLQRPTSIPYHEVYI